MDLLVLNPVTGKTTGLDKTVRQVLRAMTRSRVPYCVIGATALAARGFPRMTRVLDLTVRLHDREKAVAVLRSEGLRPATPIEADGDPEPMVVFVDPASRVEVDLLIAAGDPEWTVIGEATRSKVFGASAPVASLEHLLILYLYSNQPRHWGDFATIVQSGKADLKAAERQLRGMHAEMLPGFRRRVREAQAPPAPPKRPPRRAR
ncbi:MAG: nucleotidyltransferase family protein [Planctomycetota bacterium]|nr:nucleotidyltransferase family protein [Planctomycetota bacterium]